MPFGTSIADALRVYAGEMRDKRVMRAEEKANVLPTKLTLGTMFFTVPPLILILTPVLLPVAVELGVDPVHFGVIMVLNLMIGLTTPPKTPGIDLPKPFAPPCYRAGAMMG